MRRSIPSDSVLIAVSILVLVATMVVAGCGGSMASIPIQSAPSGPPDDADPGLGQGVRALSFGPGDKGSARISPSGDRLSFVLDGYVVEKPLYTQSSVRRTGEDLDAKGVEWLPYDSLAVLGRKTAGENAPEADVLDSLFLTHLAGDAASPREPLKIFEGVRAVDAIPDGGFVAAVEAPRDAEYSKLVLFQGRVKAYPVAIPGHVVGLSISPNASEAALTVTRDGEESDSVEILSYRLPKGPARRVAVLNRGEKILGEPQWTSEGIHFIAGAEGAPYVLYRAVEGSERPEPVRGVGEGFLPAGIETSPDGKTLAVVGRRNATSPANLYVLDLRSETLEALTVNENMEVKTDPRDIAWSPDGSGVVIVARAVLAEPKVYDAPASSLAPAFYNLYLIPAERAQPR